MVGKLEERCVLSFNAKDRFMDCTLSTLPSRILYQLDRSSIAEQESSDEENHTRRKNSSI